LSGFLMCCLLALIIIFKGARELPSVGCLRWPCDRGVRQFNIITLIVDSRVHFIHTAKSRLSYKVYYVTLSLGRLFLAWFFALSGARMELQKA